MWIKMQENNDKEDNWRRSYKNLDKIRHDRASKDGKVIINLKESWVEIKKIQEINDKLEDKFRFISAIK